jgi:hypothetical protein
MLALFFFIDMPPFLHDRHLCLMGPNASLPRRFCRVSCSVGREDNLRFHSRGRLWSTNSWSRLMKPSA